MTKLFTSKEFEPLKLEVINQFQWAVEDGEHHPEGIAFLVGSRIIGGHARNLVRKTAVADALSYLHKQFSISALGQNQRPDRVLVMTPMRRGIEEPCDPSSSLLRDLKCYLKPAGETPITVLVLGNKDCAPKTLEF